MTLSMPALLLALTIGAAAGPAAAAPIYRCGNTYSQVPCPEGGSIVEATDPRTAAQRAQARRITAAERQAAAERERDMKAAPASAPGSLSPAPAVAASAASAPKGKTHAKKAAKVAASDKDFVAAVPREPRPRK